MKLRPAALTLVLLALAPAGARAQDDAYLNEEAREMVRRARLHRTTVDLRIEAYSTTARERFTAALRAGIVEKLIYRRETATRIDWQREGPVRMEILGMREVAPLFDAKPQVPGDLSAELLRLSFDPLGDMFLRVDSVSMRNPILEGSEEHYRFEAGDTTVITLPDGRAVRLLELRIIPRRRELRLVSGSFWLDAESHAVVQAYVRPARGFDADRKDDEIRIAATASDSGEDARTRTITLNDIGGFVKPVRAEIEYIAIEYGLWEMQWWLPRRMAAHGHIQMKNIRVPLTYERTYEDYTIRGDTAGALTARADHATRRCREIVRYEMVDAARDSARQAHTESERARRARIEDAARERRGDTVAVDDCTREYILKAPSDSVLLHSGELPPTIYGDDVALIPEDDLAAIIEKMRQVPEPPFRAEGVQFQWGLQGPGLVRYNRIEGLSPAARVVVDAAPYRIDAVARIGTAELEPRGELGIERSGDRFVTRAAGYRRLLATHPDDDIPGMLGSLGAFFLGRDDTQYFEGTGAELLVRPAEVRRQWYDLRLYAERQRAVANETDFSIANLINDNNVFRPNFTADAADQVGARLRLRGSIGRNPAAPRIAGELSLGAETGDYEILRPEALLRFNTPLLRGLALGLEAAAGTVEGSAVPTQALWRLGGSSTLRGYGSNSLQGERYWRTRTELGIGIAGARVALFSDAAWAGSRTELETTPSRYSLGIGGSSTLRGYGSNALQGERYWRTRAELGFGIAGARVALFSDAAWAGSRTELETTPSRYSLGIGGTFLDGLVRLDLARAMKAERGWRLHLHFNGVL